MLDLPCLSVVETFDTLMFPRTCMPRYSYAAII